MKLRLNSAANQADIPGAHIFNSSFVIPSGPAALRFGRALIASITSAGVVARLLKCVELVGKDDKSGECLFIAFGDCLPKKVFRTFAFSVDVL